MTTVLLIGDDARERERVRRVLERAGIRVVADSEAVDDDREFPADVVALQTTAPEDGIEERLTRREQEVLELLAEGLSNRRAAARLGISEHTVKFHVASIYGKLGAASRAEAIRRAARRGLITM